jgi:molybdate transport system regulatory protein
MADSRSKVAGRKLVVRVKVWLEVDGQYTFGFGLSEILKAVEATGSIKGAARQLGKSYRYVWGRIKKAEATLGCLLVEARVGGSGSRRSGLSERAQGFVQNYDALRDRMFAVAQEEFAHRFSLPSPRRQGRP